MTKLDLVLREKRRPFKWLRKKLMPKLKCSNLYPASRAIEISLHSFNKRIRR